MGYGSWSVKDFREYSVNVRGRHVTEKGTLSDSYGAQELFTVKEIQPELKPANVVRECRDSSDHPNTIPVILALDVTGSMGCAAAEVAKKLNVVMTDLYDKVADVEFMIMGIGDLAYDLAPIQVSQFEADIRIAEQLDKVYFEGGGGGNGYESYTAAWYFGLYHTKLDCWKRGKKGIIITMGDEPLNPYLPSKNLRAVTGDFLVGDVETDRLYKAVTKKFDIYHLAVKDRDTCYNSYKNRIMTSFGTYLDAEHLITVGLDNIAGTIVNIVCNAQDGAVAQTQGVVTESNEISW